MTVVNIPASNTTDLWGAYRISQATWALAHDASSGSITTDSGWIFAQATRASSTYHLYRAGQVFDTRGIPSDAIVTSVKLKLYLKQYNSVGQFVDVVVPPTLGAAGFTVAEDFASSNFGTLVSGQFPKTGTINAAYQVTLQNFTVVGRGYTVVQFLAEEDRSNTAPTQDYWTHWHSGLASSEYRPVLIVTFSTNSALTAVATATATGRSSRVQGVGEASAVAEIAAMGSYWKNGVGSIVATSDMLGESTVKKRDGSIVAVSGAEAVGLASYLFNNTEECVAVATANAVGVSSHIIETVEECVAVAIAEGVGYYHTVIETESSSEYIICELVPEISSNLISNSCGEEGITGWDSFYSIDVVSAVSIGVVPPPGINTTFRHGSNKALASDPGTPLPVGTTTGAWVSVGFWYSAGEVAPPSTMFNVGFGWMFSNETIQYSSYDSSFLQEDGWNYYTFVTAVPSRGVVLYGDPTSFKLYIAGPGINTYTYITGVDVRLWAVEDASASNWDTCNTVQPRVRVNVVPNPRAADPNLEDWGWSWDILSRVETAPYPIPGPGTTAFKVQPNGPVATSGGVRTDYYDTPQGDYVIHEFPANGTFIIDGGPISYVQVLLVGGGGGGGSGGGGGGGVTQYTNLYLSPGTYAVAVGDGGAGAANYGTRGNTGGVSSVGTFLYADGGGGGGGATISQPPLSGGSGGGGGGTSNGGNSGGSALYRYLQLGNMGGYHGGYINSPYPAGGGGGALAAGMSAINSTSSGHGGAGITSYILGDDSPIVVGSGGGGGVVFSGTPGEGGTSGSTAGRGGTSTIAASSAYNNSGSGGGGAGQYSTTPQGGTGGRGFVVIRYPMGAASSSCGLEQNDYGTILLPADVGPEDWFSLQFDALVVNATDDNCFIWCEAGVSDIEGGGGDYPDLLNSSWPSVPEEVTDPLPLGAWQHYSFNVQLGLDEGWGGPPHNIDLMIGLNKFQDTLLTGYEEIYITNILIEPSTGADFVPAAYEDEHDTSFAYHITHPFTKVATAVYEIAAHVAQTRSFLYNTVGRVLNTITSSYDISLNLDVMRVMSSMWDVLLKISATTISRYSIDRREEDVRTLCWLRTSIGDINLNDGTNTFLRTGIKLPRRETQFDEVRSGLSNIIRQVDVRAPLSEVLLPMLVKANTAYALKTLLNDLTDKVLTGGTLEFQSGTSDTGTMPTLQTFLIGISPAPDITEDHMYRHDNMAMFELKLVAMAP